MHVSPPYGLDRPILAHLPTMVDLKTCSQCCCVFSASGICFLVFVGILLETEPLYIKDIDDASSAAQQCYIGGASPNHSVRAPACLISLRSRMPTHSGDLRCVCGLVSRRALLQQQTGGAPALFIIGLVLLWALTQSCRLRVLSRSQSSLARRRGRRGQG